MKKFFEKHDLFKFTGLFVVIAILLSWVCSYAYYSSGKLATDAITRIGLFDISTYGLLGFYYFTAVLIFVIIVGGFYKFLASTEAYQKLTTSIADKFKGKEIIFVVISILVFAILASISTEYFALFALVPFVLTILSKLKVDKITGVASTFGAILIGVLAASYSVKITGQLVSVLSVTYGFEWLVILIVFIIAYLLYCLFTVLRMGKVKVDESNVLVDPFAYEAVKETKKTKAVKVNVIPMVIVFAIAMLTIVLAFIGWSDAMGVSVFNDALTWVTEATIFDSPVYSWILGDVYAFGSWDLFAACGVLLLATLLIKFIYHISLDNVLDTFIDGFKKMVKPVGILCLVFLVLEFSVIYPTIPGIVDKIMGLGSNIFTLVISGLLTSIFTVDFQYTANIIGSMFASFENLNVAALALQFSYGLVQFIAPTSAVLMLGLALTETKFTNWFKYVWKFALAMLVVIIAVLLILMAV